MIQNAVILSTGDEITTGKVVDTNANYLSDKLAEIGIDLVAVLTVGDVPERLEWAWRTAIEKGDVVISTGGIGPTADDLTTETIALVAGVKLRRDEAAVEHMKRLFASIGRPMPENNLRQADFPEGATVIQNPLGTAPGFRIPVTLGGHTAHLIVLPGVPREKIAQFIYAEGDTSMEETVGRLLIEKKLTVAVAESCTGGLIGHRITNI